MSYTTVLPRYAGNTRAEAAQPGRSFFARLMDALMASRMRQAEREIASYLADTGGKFTDESEREIERRFLANSRGW